MNTTSKAGFLDCMVRSKVNNKSTTCRQVVEATLATQRDTYICLCQVHLLDAVVVAVDVVVLRREHANDGVILEMLDGSHVEVIHFLSVA